MLRLYPDQKTTIQKLATRTRQLIFDFNQEFYQSDKLQVDFERSNSESTTRSALTKQLTEILNEIPKFRSFAEKKAENGNIIGPLSYMAEHALYMRDPITTDKSLFLVDTPSQQRVCMIGGKAEEIFYAVRVALMDALRVSRQDRNNQIILNSQRIPAYYSRFNEPTLEKIPTSETFTDYLNRYDPQLKRDLIYLLLALSKFEGILSQPINKNLQLTPTQMQACEIGFQNLKVFINNL